MKTRESPLDAMTAKEYDDYQDELVRLLKERKPRSDIGGTHKRKEARP